MWAKWILCFQSTLLCTWCPSVGKLWHISLLLLIQYVESKTETVFQKSKKAFFWVTHTTSQRERMVNIWRKAQRKMYILNGPYCLIKAESHRTRILHSNTAESLHPTTHALWADQGASCLLCRWIFAMIILNYPQRKVFFSLVHLLWQTGAHSSSKTAQWYLVKDLAQGHFNGKDSHGQNLNDFKVSFYIHMPHSSTSRVEICGIDILKEKGTGNHCDHPYAI